jgi:ATP-dependent Clp protease adaptor protein ClpS
MTKEKTKQFVDVSEKERVRNHLVLFNDHVNSFDFVIESLVEVCGHNPMQAENCAMIAHYRGKCSVKSGSFSELEPIHNALSNRQLTVEIQ